MTPTLLGRWQTRTALLATIGVVVTAIFQIAKPGGPFFKVLFFVWLFGIGWDVVYIGLQKFRWDRDWPTVFQAGTAITEGIFIWLLVSGPGLPGIPSGSVSAKLFIAQYGLVVLTTCLFVQGPMRLVSLWWRFHGGRFV